ncbi:MAG: hypothetical protein D6690_03330 [Nitrospirae bacterium]|nr:MAG: hypothetical protein D6690_03330 [Nitrospirota bacterium]
MPQAAQRVSAHWYFVAVIWVLLCPISGFTGEQAGVDASDDRPAVASIPASNLDVDRATARVSVSQETPSAIQTFLRACQTDLPEFIPINDPAAIQELQALCKNAERWMHRHVPPPVHHLAPTSYAIHVPLKTPYRNIQAVLWRAKNLDEALTFVRMLQSGALHSVTVFATVPGNEERSRPCRECPVKELVFRLTHIKDGLKSLRPPNGRE